MIFCSDNNKQLLYIITEAAHSNYHFMKYYLTLLVD